MSAALDSPPTDAQPKFSRYRSVRTAQNPHIMALRQNPVSMAEPETDNAGVKRSMSRYRRTRVATAPPEKTPATPVLPPNILSSKASTQSQLRGRYHKSSIPDFQQPQKRSTSIPIRRNTDTQPVDDHVDQYFPVQGQLHKSTSQTINQQKGPALFPPTKFTEEDAARILKEQKRKDLERLEGELASAQVAKTSPSKKVSGFFSRKKTSAKASPPASSDESILLTKTRSDGPRGHIEPGGGGVVPQTDAPMSAVNAGERRVLVRCKQSSIVLPVTPETTAKDLVYTALNVLGQNLNPATAVLCESYTQLGLERRIRRYETIREVMNSWDRDTQNAIHIQASDSPKGDLDLEASYAPGEKPSDVSMLMYHSAKPGKWSKRFINLLSSGQVFVSKKNHAKATDKDVQSICHLSDFDIYTPTPSQLRKVLRPPKKFCYAIKSQQKTTIFQSTENYVHFFCTEDYHVAEEWSAAVQKWRSWYLVNKLVNAVKSPTDPYTIGTFTPLIDLSKQTSPAHQSQHDSSDDYDDENTPRQIPFHLRHGAPASRPRGPPPSAFPKVTLPSSGDMPIAEIPTDGTAFSPTGLLGRTYSQRQKAQRDKEAALRDPAGATLIDGPSLRRTSNEISSSERHAHNQASGRTMSLRRPSISAAPTTSLTRNPSTKRPDIKPLIDLTPSFKEAPQWSKEGKGRGVAAPSGIPLVEAAVSTWDAVAMAQEMNPQLRTFRREDTRPPDAGRRRDESRTRDRGRGESRPRTSGRDASRVRAESRVRGERRGRE